MITYISVDASWVDAAVAQAEKNGGLWVSLGMYGTYEISGFSAVNKRAERLTRKK